MEAVFKKDGLYLVSDKIQAPERYVFSAGVKIGELQKGRIVPHHRFFMACADIFCQKIDLELGDPRVEKYLRGEEISVSDFGNVKGWAVVTCDEAALGGVKVSQGVAKNHYPKGLRIKN